VREKSKEKGVTMDSAGSLSPQPCGALHFCRKLLYSFPGPDTACPEEKEGNIITIIIIITPIYI